MEKGRRYNKLIRCLSKYHYVFNNYNLTVSVVSYSENNRRLQADKWPAILRCCGRQ